jgi:phenylalanyl-tRNA synthetase beta chain
LKLEPLLMSIEAADAARRFKPLARFPAVERDFALVLADGVTFAQVKQTISQLGIPEITAIEAADLFRGGQIPSGKFSLMIRVKFQSAEATFTDSQVTDFSARIVNALQEKLGATLRSA